MLRTAQAGGVSARAAVIALVVAGQTACALLNHYAQGVTPAERLEECRLLDRKVTEAGQMNAIGVFLAGGAGLAAGLKDQNRQAFGYISGAFGLFAALTQYIWTRQSGRFASRNCQLILDFNPQDTALTNAIAKLQYRPFVLDSLQHARDSVRAALKRSKPPR